MKRKGSKIFFASMRKKCFFQLFCINAKRRNLKRNENKTKNKNCHHFRFEEKWSETEEKIFWLPCKKSVFHIWSEMKMKWSEIKTEMKRKLQSEILGRSIKKQRKILRWSFNLSSLYLVKWKEAKKRLFCFFALKRNKAKKFISFCFEAKQSENALN